LVTGGVGVNCRERDWVGKKTGEAQRTKRVTPKRKVEKESQRGQPCHEKEGRGRRESGGVRKGRRKKVKRMWTVAKKIKKTDRGWGVGSIKKGTKEGRGLLGKSTERTDRGYEKGGGVLGGPGKRPKNRRKKKKKMKRRFTKRNEQKAKGENLTESRERWERGIKEKKEGEKGPKKGSRGQRLRTNQEERGVHGKKKYKRGIVQGE